MVSQCSLLFFSFASDSVPNILPFRQIVGVPNVSFPKVMYTSQDTGNGLKNKMAARKQLIRRFGALFALPRTNRNRAVFIALF